MNLFPMEPFLFPAHNPVNCTNGDGLSAVVAGVLVESGPLKPLLVERLSRPLSHSAKGFSIGAGTAEQCARPACA